jgi:hypothetical protein
MTSRASSLSFRRILPCLAAGLVAEAVSAQIFIVSNLASEDPGRLTVSPGVGLATSFTTGSAAQPLYGVLLGLAGAPADIAVALHADHSGEPGRLVTSLTGPTGTGQNLYLDPLSTLLTPSSTYWVLLESTAGVTGLAIDRSDTIDGLPGWTIGPSIRISPGAGRRPDPSSTMRFGVLTTSPVVPPVPEPEEWALMAGAALVGFGFWRRCGKAR